MSKKLYRNIDHLLQQVDTSLDSEQVLHAILERLVHADAVVYGIESGRLYRERARDYLLIESRGEFGEAITGKTVSKDYPIIRELERERLIRISPETPGFDPELEAQFSHLDNAAILVGANPAYILSFSIHHTGSSEELLVMLETIRAAIGLRLRQKNLEDQLLQAQSIQMSLLPRHLPRMEGFDIAAATIPADEVGGDVYDVQRVDTDTLGIMVADASGHGLPAALQARDVVVGLRMGTDKDEKITATIQRLNRVIHMGGLASRFISLFYGEVERTGDIFYVNCGHCPPLLVTADGEYCELLSSGPVLGPLPKARFRRCYARLQPGDCLVIFSDGVIERTAPGDGADEPTALPSEDEEVQEFGREGLLRICRANLGRGARTLVNAIIDAVREFGGGTPFEDDVTVFVLRYRRRRNRVES